jgi:hypothetical protein
MFYKTQEDTEAAKKDSLVELIRLLINKKDDNQPTTVSTHLSSAAAGVNNSHNNNSYNIKRKVPTSPEPPQNLSGRPGPPYDVNPTSPSGGGGGAFAALLESMLKRPGLELGPQNASTADIVLGGLASRPVNTQRPPTNSNRPGKKSPLSGINSSVRYYYYFFFYLLWFH